LRNFELRLTIYLRLTVHVVDDLLELLPQVGALRIMRWHARRLLPEHVADDDGRLTMSTLLQAAQRAKAPDKTQ